MHHIATTRIRLAALLALGALLVPDGIAAQTSPPCEDPEFRQLDFWIGAWEVADAGGQVIGRSTVSATLGRCAIQEEWESGDMHGTSINAYDKPEGAWRQMWVDSFGAVLRLRGAWNGRSMVLGGPRVGSDGRTRHLRVTLTPMEDGTLRQLQERSEDGGETWGVIFDGRYTRVIRPIAGSPRSAPCELG
jgi:hypothetical protein